MAIRHAARMAWWMLVDGGGDVVAMCERVASGSSAYAAVSAQWTYDAYGAVIDDDVFDAASPVNRAGHKGLFADRLNVGVVDEWGHENCRLIPGAELAFYNRNRTYSPYLGRFLQSDPNATGVVTQHDMRRHGSNSFAAPAAFDLEEHYGDGFNTVEYLGSASWTRNDPSGLFIPGPSDLISGALESLVTEYAARQEYDLEWAMSWEAEDGWHSRLDSKWVYVALGRGLHGAFDIFGYNPLGDYDGRATAGFKVPGSDFRASVRRMYAGLTGQLHHIATIYGKYGVEFQILFKKAGVAMNDAINALPVPGHAGRHLKKYHAEVLARLKRAIGSKSGKDATNAFHAEMVRIRRDIVTGKLKLNN